MKKKEIIKKNKGVLSSGGAGRIYGCRPIRKAQVGLSTLPQTCWEVYALREVQEVHAWYEGPFGLNQVENDGFKA